MFVPYISLRRSLDPAASPSQTSWRAFKHRTRARSPTWTCNVSQHSFVQIKLINWPQRMLEKAKMKINICPFRSRQSHRNQQAGKCLRTSAPQQALAPIQAERSGGFLASHRASVAAHRCPQCRKNESMENTIYFLFYFFIYDYEIKGVCIINTAACVAWDCLGAGPRRYRSTACVCFFVLYIWWSQMEMLTDVQIKHSAVACFSDMCCWSGETRPGIPSDCFNGPSLNWLRIYPKQVSNTFHQTLQPMKPLKKKKHHRGFQRRTINESQPSIQKIKIITPSINLNQILLPGPPWGP